MAVNDIAAAYRARQSGSFELPNPLHKYASYNALFTLSALTEGQIKSGSYLTDTKLYSVIARSAGIGPTGNQHVFRDDEIKRFEEAGPGIQNKIEIDRQKKQYEGYEASIDLLQANHDIFFENINILSTIGPNNERNLANFTKMEFEMHEPYGVTLVEKIRAATFLAGYLDYQDAPLLLTIEFRGFDENGNTLKQGMSETRKIPILIAKVDFDVNEGGARYSIVAVPYGDLGFDDRFKVARTQFDLTTSYFLGKGGWKEKMEDGLADMMTQEIEEKARLYEDKYQFEIEDGLLSNLGDYVTDEDISIHGGNTVAVEHKNLAQGFQDNSSSIYSGQTQQVDSGTTVTKAFEDFLLARPGFFDLARDFWRAYLTMAGYPVPNGKEKDQEAKRTKYIQDLLTDESKTRELQAVLLKHQYVPWFKIKSTVFTQTGRGIDPITKMHPKKIVYKAIPYKIHVLKLLSTGFSIGSVDWSTLVRKNYDYIYTGENQDVQNLRINYKTAYYMRNVRGDDKSENESAIQKAVRATTNLVFGREQAPEPLLPLRNYPSNIKGRSTVEVTGRKGGHKVQEFFDYLVNPTADMMRIEIDILGDPHFLCQDVFTTLKELNDKKTDRLIRIDSDFDENQFGSFNADQYMPMINLRYRLPTDILDKQGTMFGDGQTVQDNLFFNGIYQVYKVESKFDTGQFLQTLFCVRMNNQQGQGLAPSVINTVNKYTNTIAINERNEKDKIAARKQKARDKINTEFMNNERLDDADGNVPGL